MSKLAIALTTLLGTGAALAASLSAPLQAANLTVRFHKSVDQPAPIKQAAPEATPSPVPLPTPAPCIACGMG